MNNFTFYNPTRILFGKGQIANIKREIPAGAKVLVTYGGGSIKSNGVYEQIAEALAGYTWGEFGGIEANPGYHTLLRALEKVREEGYDYLLAVGGGSVADGTKFIALAACFEGDPWLILSERARPKTALPLGVVLTLPATGSEANANGVVTNYQTHEKLSFNSPLVYPRFAVLDPRTTFSLPPRQIANGIVDAFIHTLEQYLTYPVNAPLQDRFAESILVTLIEEGPRAMGNPDDYDVRANIMWCATQALNGLIGVGVPQDWATHMIGHELTALHGIDHGRTLAIVLPALLQEKRDTKRGKLLQYAERVWGLREGDEERRIDQAIARTRAFFESLGVPTRLAEYGVNAADIDPMIEALVQHGMVTLGERQDITPDVSRRILQAAL